ncbi:MAG: hypothetical protein ABFE07_28650 [Armatimonadia bacterium]
MNYYQPCQLANADGSPSGVWHYTKKWGSEGVLMPIGYCAQGGAEHAHKSAEEACECYKTYLLDQARYNLAVSPSSRPRCRVLSCPHYTGEAAEIDHILYALCPEHMNRKTLSEVFGEVGQGCASW